MHFVRKLDQKNVTFHTKNVNIVAYETNKKKEKFLNFFFF